jgi:enoyl-CoA hydratase/carnithine racemase
VMCDLRIAVPETYFSHPEIAFGDVLYSPLHDLVGAAVARDLCLTGRRVDAEEARELRLVSRVVPRAELDEEVARWAAMIARAPREVLLRTKGKAIARARISSAGTLDL